MTNSVDGPARYRTHSPYTDPGRQAPLLRGLPTDLRALTQVVQGLLFHYEEGPMYDHVVAPGRVQADEARTVEGMLTKILALDSAPLTTPRPPGERLVGCCRDYALLLTALLREQGVPARVRWGYARYFAPHFAYDHVVTEVWNAPQRRWILVDAQQDERHVQANGLRFDPHDLPRAEFATAAEVWAGVRGLGWNPDHYGYSPVHACGLWAVQHYLLFDLAALQKVELLHGDRWGLREVEPGDRVGTADLALLDVVASLMSDLECRAEALDRLYQDIPVLRVPSRVRHTPLDTPGAPAVAVDLP